MLRTNQSPAILIFLLLFFTHHSLAHNPERRVLKRRTLMGIKETPAGGNLTFDCSPSGPCIPCSRSEKRDESYRCGETGYRIRLKCIPVGSGSEDVKSLKEKKTRSALESADLRVNDGQRRTLLSDTAKSEGVSGAYVTHRSCIPAVSEEKLSVLGFEQAHHQSPGVKLEILGRAIQCMLRGQNFLFKKKYVVGTWDMFLSAIHNCGRL